MDTWVNKHSTPTLFEHWEVGVVVLYYFYYCLTIKIHFIMSLFKSEYQRDTVIGCTFIGVFIIALITMITLVVSQYDDPHRGYNTSDTWKQMQLDQQRVQDEM